MANVLASGVEQRAGGADEEGDGDELEDRDDISVEEGSVRCPPKKCCSHLPPQKGTKLSAWGCPSR